MFKIRFAGGAMDGRVGRDENAPESVRYIAPGERGPEVYVHSSTDEDGTLVYRKK